MVREGGDTPSFSPLEDVSRLPCCCPSKARFRARFGRQLHRSDRALFCAADVGHVPARRVLRHDAVLPDVPPVEGPHDLRPKGAPRSLLDRSCASALQLPLPLRACSSCCSGCGCGCSGCASTATSSPCCCSSSSFCSQPRLTKRRASVRHRRKRSPRCRLSPCARLRARRPNRNRQEESVIATRLLLSTPEAPRRASRCTQPAVPLI